MDKNRINKLLVLKAFYLGRAISEKNDFIWAIQEIDTAISRLELLHDDKSRLRLIFYVLLKAEARREFDDVLEIRKYAKKISSEIIEEIYDDYMRIENATQTLKKAYGLEKGYIADKGIKNSSGSRTVKNRNKITTEYYDTACAVIGININELSNKELNFLHNVSLVEMLKYHGLQK